MQLILWTKNRSVPFRGSNKVETAKSNKIKKEYAVKEVPFVNLGIRVSILEHRENFPNNSKTVENYSRLAHINLHCACAHLREVLHVEKPLHLIWSCYRMILLDFDITSGHLRKIIGNLRLSPYKIRGG